MRADIYIYGEIGTRTGQVSLKAVKSQILKEADSYVVHIISPGGDVFEGYSIYNAIKNDTYGKTVHVHIEGLCASIATLIAAVGIPSDSNPEGKIVMNRTGDFMIHNPHITDLKGDANQLRSVANQLDQIKTLLINVYKGRTGMSDEKLWELYDNETHLTPDQAVQMGFIDEAVDAIRAVARIDLNTFKMKESIITQIKNFFKNSPIKAQQIVAQMSETLADGRVVIIMTEDEDWIGKQVVLEDGAPLEDGTFDLPSGKSITVAGGIITQASDNQPTTEDMNKIKELETQLAEAKAALEQANATKAAAEAEVANAQKSTSNFQAKLDAMSKDFLALQERMSKTFGDTTPEPKGPVLKNAKEQKIDPMGEDALVFYKNRNLIN